MIEAYRIGVSLVLDQSRLLPPALEAFEKIQKAISNTQRGLNEMVASLRGALRVANSLADAMDKVAAAATQTARAGMATATSSGGPRVARMAPLALPAPGGALAMPGYGGALQGVPGAGIPLNLQPNAASYPAVNWGAGLQFLYRGMAAVQVVDMVVGGIDRLIDKAKGLNDALVVLQQRGMNAAETRDLEGEAFDIARRIPGRDVSRILSDAGNLRAVLGDQGGADPLADVKAILPEVERIAAALSAATGDDRETSMHALMRAVELRGGLIDPSTHRISAERFASELDTIYKVLISGGGMIGSNDLLNLMQQAGPMARMMDADQFYGMMMTAVLDMKGHRAGTALSAAGRQLFGGRMSLAFADEMAKIGLIPEGSFKRAGSGYITLNTDAQKQLTDSMHGGLFEWVQKVLRPHMLEHGFVTDEQQSQELYKIMSTETFRRLSALFLQNSDQVLRDQKLIAATPSPMAALELAKKSSIGFNLDAAETSFMNFLQAVEKVNAGAIVGVLHAAQSLFDWLAQSGFNEDKLHHDAGQSMFGDDPFYKHWPWERKFWTSEPAQHVQMQGDVYLDGDKVGRVIANQQGRDASRPPTTPSGPDINLGPTYPMPGWTR
jgi:hypothetical protein